MEFNNLGHAWACKKFHAFALVKNSSSTLSLREAN